MGKRNLETTGTLTDTGHVDVGRVFMSHLDEAAYCTPRSKTLLAFSERSHLGPTDRGEACKMNSLGRQGGCQRREAALQDRAELCLNGSCAQTCRRMPPQGTNEVYRGK